MLPLTLLLAGAALFGHLVIWTYLFNALHATAVPCRVIRISERVLAALTVFPALAVGVYWAIYGYDSGFHLEGVARLVVRAYVAACWFSTALAVGFWIDRALHRDRAHGLVSNDTVTHSIRNEKGELPVRGGTAAWLARLPGNQIFELGVHHKQLRVPQLPAALDGLTVAHLTDLHMTGKITEPFFQRVVDLTLEASPDLIVLTGDLVEHPDCLEWLPRTLGRLQAKHGVFAILGNHDVRMPDVGELRRELTAAGLVDLGGRWKRIRARGESILLAGNEHPWFAAPQDLPARSDSREFRLALVHTPDVIPWAVRHDFQLVVAGHTHGGQIRFPLIGPVICPSRYGLRYASGVFREGNTVMHVSRGVGGLHPVRFNCPPELAILELQAG